jgi:hypothetical protein
MDFRDIPQAATARRIADTAKTSPNPFHFNVLFDSIRSRSEGGYYTVSIGGITPEVENDWMRSVEALRERGYKAELVEDLTRSSKDIHDGPSKKLVISWEN